MQVELVTLLQFIDASELSYNIASYRSKWNELQYCKLWIEIERSKNYEYILK